MQGKFERLLRSVFLVAAILVCGAVIVAGVVLVFQRFEIVGDKASLGDALTFGSIIFAALVATLGWLIVEWRERAERKRIAMADAVIIHRKLAIVTVSIWGMLISATNRKGRPRLDFFSPTVEKTDASVASFYGWLIPRVTDFRQALSEIDTSIESLRTLYMYDTKFGDHFMSTLEGIDVLRSKMDDFPRSRSTAVRAFVANPKIEEANCYFLFEAFAQVALGLEFCRKGLVRGGAISAFEFGYSDIQISAFNRRFYETLGLPSPIVGKALSEREYACMLMDVRKFYRAAHAIAYEAAYSN